MYDVDEHVLGGKVVSVLGTPRLRVRERHRIILKRMPSAMTQKFQISASTRHRFCAPVELRWLDGDGISRTVSGRTENASVYGLGIVIPSEIRIGTEVSVILNGVGIAGSARVCHLRPRGSEFRSGLAFKQALFMQGVPGLDEVLVDSFYSARSTRKPARVLLLRRMRARFWRAMFRSGRLKRPKDD